MAGAVSSLPGCTLDAVRPHTVYSPADRPDAEVLVDGEWRSAEIRMWSRDDAGSWFAQCDWNEAPGINRIDTFPADQVRPVG